MVTPEDELRYYAFVRLRDDASRDYLAILKSSPPVLERTKNQQRLVDMALDDLQKASYKVWHFGVLDGAK